MFACSSRPKYACWLNLIEPWWKQLRSLALNGRHFETQAELEAAFHGALTDWNVHKRPCIWKKRPQEHAELDALFAAAHCLGGYGAELIRKPAAI